MSKITYLLLLHKLQVQNRAVKTKNIDLTIKLSPQAKKGRPPTVSDEPVQTKGKVGSPHEQLQQQLHMSLYPLRGHTL